MPKPLKSTALIVFGLAILFWWSFMFAKHDPHLRIIIPFGDDPYDAVGSFGVIVAILIALLSLVRAFRPYRNPPSEAQRLYLVRSQEAVVLAVLITVSADIVAMVRHPSTWTKAPSRPELLLLVIGVAVVAFGVHWLIRKSVARSTDISTNTWGKAALVAVIATVVLALYPEQLIQHFGTHVLTVLIGDFLLFAPMRSLLTSLVPYSRDERLAGAAQQSAGLLTSWGRWSMVVILGISVGLLIFAAEMSEGSGPMPPIRVLFVGLAYVGLALAGLLVAYTFLAAPLGLQARG